MIHQNEVFMLSVSTSEYFTVGVFFASVCPDSEVTEGPESGTRAFAEGVEGERQEAAAGV